MIKQLSFLIVLCISLNCLSQETNNEVKFPRNYTSKLNVIYVEVGKWKGRMDIYFQKETNVLTPLVINIHGGGWNHGSKESQTGFNTFFRNGYAVANIEYRLVDVAPAPAAIEDVRCALIYLLHHRGDLNIDPNKIVIMGGSAGGHLALMGGLLSSNKTFDVNCGYKGKISVAAIVDKYGVTDLTPFHAVGSAKKWLGDNFNNVEFVEAMSPINYVIENSPPVFIVHGDADPIVPFDQSQKLYKALLSVGVKTEFMTISNGGHGKFTKEQKEDINRKMLSFLKELGI